MSPLDLQRIVDGELDHVARAQILGAFGEDVRAWRSLALALLEEQQWARQLQGDPFPSDSVHVSKGVHASKGSEQSLRVPPEAMVSAPVPSITRVGRKGALGSPWFTALAASVLLCIGMAGGMLLRSPREADRDHLLAAQAVDNSNAIRSSNSAAPRPERDRKLPMKMVLNGPGGSEGLSLEIPVVDASEIDPKTLWARDAQELSKLQQKLKREGYRMEWQPRLYSGRLNDGREVVVPVHNVALKSVGL